MYWRPVVTSAVIAGVISSVIPALAGAVIHRVESQQQPFNYEEHQTTLEQQALMGQQPLPVDRCPWMTDSGTLDEYNGEKLIYSYKVSAWFYCQNIVDNTTTISLVDATTGDVVTQDVPSYYQFIFYGNRA